MDRKRKSKVRGPDGLSSESGHPPLLTKLPVSSPVGDTC